MQHTTTRFALLILSCSLVACDTGAPDAAALDLHVAGAALAAAGRAGVEVHDEVDLEPFADDDLRIDAPTLRDVVEGRVAPQISAAFATPDEPCPQALAAAGLAAAPPPARTLAVEVEELSLDTPISEACLRHEASTGAVALVACAPGEAALGDLTASQGIHDGNCYWCGDGLPCFGSKRRYEGWVVGGQCVSVGYAGCNCT